MRVSVSAIKRRMSEDGLSVNQTYSSIADNHLRDMITDIQKEFPEAGYQTIGVVLNSKGIKVQQHSLRCAVKDVDPEGELMKRQLFSANRMHRWTYSVRA